MTRRVVPASYQGTPEQLVAASVDRHVVALYINMYADELITVAGTVEVWPHRPWSTCLRDPDGQRWTLVEGWLTVGADLTPVPHPCLVAILAVTG